MMVEHMTDLELEELEFLDLDDAIREIEDSSFAYRQWQRMMTDKFFYPYEVEKELENAGRKYLDI